MGNTYAFNLTITCTGLYCPNIPGQTQARVLGASQAAVDVLVANGVTVSGNVRPKTATRFGVK